MPENLTDSRRSFAPRFLPWLLTILAFLLYCLTLNHWVSLFNINMVSKISGLTWQPDVLNPVLFVATFPIRWLPAAQIPVALNLFSAICAAVTLGLLARSVAILPHDRTDVQRNRERSDFSFLTIKNSWLPPVLAVAVCGLQLTFWERATNCAGDMFDLLLFAFVIWSILEYRLDEREWRLFAAALVYGAGMAENWAMVGFFPLFLAAIIWTRKLSFFKLDFLGRMALCGLAGMLFYLLLPLLTVIDGKVEMSFWQALKANLSGQWYFIKIFFTNSNVRQTVGLLSLISLMPVFFISLRWKSSFGDGSYIGSVLATIMFHLIHAMLLIVSIWVAFDPPFSARNQGFGLPFLTFYFLGAMVIGYCAGYFLLVFRPEIRSRSSRRKPSGFETLNTPAVVAVFAISIVAIIGLGIKNAPQIHETNGNTFAKYATLVDESLPKSGGILLCDDPLRLLLVETSLAKEGRSKEFIPLDTQSLNYPAYHKFLHKRYLQKWPDTIVPSEMTNGISPLHLIAILTSLSKSNELYYLHPSFGYYFEQFYLEPHGLVYKLKILPQDNLLPPKPDKNLIAENESFWAKAETSTFEPIEREVAEPDPNAPQSFVAKVFKKMHVKAEPNLNLITAGTYYSRSLNFWGVELQRANDLSAAAAHFETAQKLNPDNVIASINLDLNKKLSSKQNLSVDLDSVSTDNFGKARTWNKVLNEDGPFDDPSYCFVQAQIFANQSGLFRQSVALLDRVRELVPNYLPARISLASCYLVSRLPDAALETLREPLDNPSRFSLNETNSTQFNLLCSAAYFQKGETSRGTQLIEREITRHPTNEDLLITATKAYLASGFLTNALGVVNHKLKYTPDDPIWLFTKGFILNTMKDYDAAAKAMSRVLSIQTNNPQALFGRATAYLGSDNLDAAKADYETLFQTYTNSFQIEYGLGEIAWRKHDTNEAIKNYENYLLFVGARTNTAEATNVIERLNSLRH